MTHTLADSLARYMMALDTEIISDQKFADELAAMAKAMRQANNDRAADAVLACSRQVRIRALQTSGNLAALRSVIASA